MMKDAILDLEHLTKGIYFLKIKSEGKTYSKKFIKS